MSHLRLALIGVGALVGGMALGGWIGNVVGGGAGLVLSGIIGLACGVPAGVFIADRW